MVLFPLRFRATNQAIPSLIRVLADSNPGVREATAWSLGRIGPEARPSIDSLIKLLKHSSNKVRIRSAEALIKLGECEAAIPVLMEFLKEGNNSWDVEDAVSVLGDIGLLREIWFIYQGIVEPPRVLAGDFLGFWEELCEAQIKL